MPSTPRSPVESTVIVANGVGSRTPSLITRIEPSCWVTKIRPSGACANAVERRETGDPGLVAGEAARLRGTAGELHQRRRPVRDVARSVARPRPQHVLAAGVEAGVDGGGIRRGGVDGADGHAVDLELDAGHGDVVAGRGGDRRPCRSGRRRGRPARSASPSAGIPPAADRRPSRRRRRHRRRAQPGRGRAGCEATGSLSGSCAVPRDAVRVRPKAVLGKSRARCRPSDCKR